MAIEAQPMRARGASGAAARSETQHGKGGWEADDPWEKIGLQKLFTTIMCSINGKFAMLAADSRHN